MTWLPLMSLMTSFLLPFHLTHYNSIDTLCFYWSKRMSRLDTLYFYWSNVSPNLNKVENQRALGALTYTEGSGTEGRGNYIYVLRHWKNKETPTPTTRANTICIKTTTSHPKGGESIFLHANH